MILIGHFVMVLFYLFTFWNPWTPNFVDWVGQGAEQAEAKVMIGAAYAAAAFAYGWIVTRVEVFQAYRKLPHTLIGVAIFVLWGTAVLLMLNGVIPIGTESFYPLAVASAAIAVAIEVVMHAEARRGPGADRIAAKVAKAHKPGGTVR